MEKLKVSTIGSSAGIILSKSILATLQVQKGDALFLTKAPGGYRLTPYDPEFEEQFKAAESIMKSDRDILRVLAK